MANHLLVSIAAKVCNAIRIGKDGGDYFKKTSPCTTLLKTTLNTDFKFKFSK